MNSEDLKQLLADIKKNEDFILSTRREIHKYPELGLDEFRTADLICSKLTDMGIEYSRKETAVTALIKGKQETPCVALRADIDALPITEDTGLDYSSCHPGKMHACGHDGHTAILLGAAKWLAEHREQLNGSVKLFFQPAEESSGGADPMIRNGALENPPVDKVFGLHVMPYMEPGFIEVKKGPLNGSSTAISIIVKGVSGHGAYPETAVDAIMVAAHVITAAQTLVSRRVSPLEQAVISFGVIEGGSAGNIIADKVAIRGTMRTTNDKVRDLLIEQLKELVKHTCAAHGADCEVTISYSYAALINDSDETDRVARVAGELLGKKAVLWKEHPSMGVEDFSFFLKERPGAFYHLGCGFAGERDYALHSSGFVLNEDCLVYGAAMQTALVLDVFEGDMK